MRGFQAMAAAVAAEKVEVVFGVLGGSIDRMVHSLVHDHGIRFVATRHEQGAVGMADGYSRATDRIGVATCEKGPGLTNTSTAMTTARLSGSSVLLIAGDKVAGSRFGNMDIEQPPVIQATAGALQQVNTPYSMAAEVQTAFRHLRLGLGPIALNVPTSFSESEMPEGWAYTASDQAVVPPQAPVPDPTRLAAVAALLGRSRRPLILAGRGAVRSQAREALAALADRVGGVLATSLAAKGYFRGHSFDLGISGGFAPPQAREILKEVDLVVAFGAALNFYTVDHGRLYGNATLVQVDSDRSQIGLVTPVADSIVADAKAAAEALLRELGQGSGNGWRSAELAARIAAIDPWAEYDFSERDGYLNRHELVRICEEMLPRERLLAVDIGHFMGLPTAHISVPDPRDLVLPWRLGAIGSGLTNSIGAALGRPDRLTVLFVGDAGLMMTLQELETAARNRIPMLVIVENDQGHGSERSNMNSRGEDGNLATIPTPDFAAVAKALGCDGESIANADHLRSVLSRLGRLERPLVLDVAISPDEADTRMSYVRSGGPV
jgi:thiamine pyrophosphate-dependent acetolactate synthase large subunit-like protein